MTEDILIYLGEGVIYNTSSKQAPKLRAFRYMEREHAEMAVNDGCLRIATTTSVAHLESGLRDKADATISMRAVEYVQNPADDPGAIARLKRVGYDIGPNARDISVNAHYEERTPAYIFCCTDIPNNQHILNQNPKGNVIVEIDDLIGLCHVLTNSSAVLMSVYKSDTPEGATRIACAGVSYRSTHHDGVRVDLRSDPLVKHPSFEPEREIRITWNATRPNIGPIFVTNPELRKFLRIVNPEEI